jgi:hypothetical protein
MKRLTLICSVMLLFFASCAEKIDGSSEAKFKASTEKIKSKLSNEEQNKFDVALRVIIASAMKHKFENPAVDKGKSFDEIARQMINGKSYADLTEMAEDFIKKDHQRDIDELKKDMADLTARKAQEVALKKQLDMLKGRLLKIDLVNGEPTIFAEFKNLSKDTLYRFTCSVYLKTDSGKYITSSTSNSHTGKNSASGTVNPNDTFVATAGISQNIMKDYPQVPWKNLKYPVDSLTAYHLVAGGMTKQLRMYEQVYDLDEVKWEYWDEQKLNKMNAVLKKLEAFKPTLADLEIKK